MTKTAGLILVNKIAPLIYGAIRKGRVKATGCEDRDELAQDCLAMAAQQLDAAEAKGQPYTPGTIAFYALQNMKTGRRSTCASRTDVLAPATQLEGRASVRSMDEPITVADDGTDGCDAPSLHDVLSSEGEDPAHTAGRRIDWDHALRQLDSRQQDVLQATAVGVSVSEVAQKYRVSPPRVVQLKREAAATIKKTWGGTGIAEAAQSPAWKCGMRAIAERHAGRARRAGRLR